MSKEKCVKRLEKCKTVRKRQQNNTGKGSKNKEKGSKKEISQPKYKKRQVFLCVD